MVVAVFDWIDGCAFALACIHSALFLTRVGLLFCLLHINVQQVSRSSYLWRPRNTLFRSSASGMGLSIRYSFMVWPMVDKLDPPSPLSACCEITFVWCMCLYVCGRTFVWFLRRWMSVCSMVVVVACF